MTDVGGGGSGHRLGKVSGLGSLWGVTPSRKDSKGLVKMIDRKRLDQMNSRFPEEKETS